RGVLVGVAVGEGPFQVWIARRRGGRGEDLQRNPWCILGQDDESAAPRAQGADRRRVLIALRSRDSLVMIRASPGVVGGPRSRRRHLEDAVRPPAGER